VAPCEEGAKRVRRTDAAVTASTSTEAEPPTELPRYVAMIADGNRRWARARGLPPGAGHEAGADTLRARIEDAANFGVRELTIYSFSTENWSRPQSEVADLLEMLARRVAGETPGLYQQGVRMRFIGQRAAVPTALAEQMSWAEELTSDNRRLTVFVAFNYGGRSEIVDAAAKFTGGSEAEFRACFYAPEMHDPDLVIRTGGERRLSNYLLWQAAYSELMFRDELWPDFTRESLKDCAVEFRTRRRRFGAR
jgi:undecaprenyl diphosphate synthase